MHPLLTEAIARDHQARLAQDALPRHTRPVRPARRGLRRLAQALVGARPVRRRPAVEPTTPIRRVTTVEGATWR